MAPVAVDACGLPLNPPAIIIASVLIAFHNKSSAHLLCRHFSRQQH
jgi:hypothetical protein